MIVKNIDFDGYNRAIVQKMYENGDLVCDVQTVQVDEMGEEIIKQDTNLVFISGSIELTQDEILDLSGINNGAIQD